MIDPVSNSILLTGPAGRNPRVAVSDGNNVWVATAGEDTVSKIDPAAGTIISRITVGEDAGGLTFDGTAIWITIGRSPTNFRVGAVSRIDPATDEVTETIAVGNKPLGLVSDGTNIWVANYGDGTVSKLTP